MWKYENVEMPGHPADENANPVFNLIINNFFKPSPGVRRGEQ